MWWGTLGSAATRAKLERRSDRRRGKPATREEQTLQERMSGRAREGLKAAEGELSESLTWMHLGVTGEQ